MARQRSNDSSDKPEDLSSKRMSRGYEINGQWYFELRGGGQKGPFETEEAMLAELNEFILLHENMKQVDD